MTKKRLLIIPARAGSKRIKNKNIRDFAGKPMIVHSIETALESKLFDEIHVSTESSVIRDIVESAGCKIPFLRSENLSDDFSTTIDVYKFVVEKYISLGMCFDEVWALLPCAPLISSSDLHNAYDLFLKYKCKHPVVSVTECNCREQQSFKIEKDFLFFNDGAKLKIRSQDIESKYKSAGAFAIFPTAHVRESNLDNFSEASLGYVLSKVKAVDIDEEEDWELAEAIYFGRRINK